MISYIIAIVFFLILEAFFSGSELALFSINRTKLKYLAKEGDKRAKKVYEALEKHFDEYIATTLIGTTLSIVSITSIFVSFLHQVGEYIFILKSKEEILAESIIVITLLFGEILPKSIFQHYADKIIYFIIPILDFFRKLFFPLTTLAKLITKIVFFIFRIKGKEEKVLSREELIDILITEGGEIEDLQKKIIVNVLLFNQRRLSEIVVPLSDVVAVDISSKVKDVIPILKDTGFSRIPIYNKRIDAIEKVVKAFDLKNANPEDPISKYAKKIRFVPEFASLPNVLKGFKRHRDHMVVVVDERGATMGITTLEDVLEEIVGDIRDEFKKEKEKEMIIKKFTKDKIKVDGRIDIREVETLMGVKLPKGIYQTVAGLIIYTLGRMPKKNESIEIEELRFTVEEVDDKRVKVVSIEKIYNQQG
ncbi:MAG: HlyC/CorC family transporter [Persephonella sp.]|nr:MAG: HlyC/CorC family transporter [Persephonella sp.]